MTNIETVTRIERSQFGQYKTGMKIMHKKHWCEVVNIARPYRNMKVAVLTVRKLKSA